MTKTRPAKRIDVEQVLVRRRAGQVAEELIEQPAVRRRQQFPGDGAEKGRRHERRRHQQPYGAAQRHVGARHQPAHGRGDSAADERGQRGELEGGEQRIEIGGVDRPGGGNSPSVKAPLVVGEGVEHQPRQRQHDQHAQHGGEQQQHRLRQVDAEAELSIGAVVASVVIGAASRVRPPHSPAREPAEAAAQVKHGTA